MRSLRAIALTTLLSMFGSIAIAAGSSEMAGIWRIGVPVTSAKTNAGSVPPLRPSARKIYRERVQRRARKDTAFDPSTWCASPGIPRLMFIDDPFEIVIRPHQVLFLFHWNRWTRLVDLSGAKLEVLDPSSMGTPTGSWDGQTLVIETVGLKGSTLLDSAGLPHSENAKITERLRLRGHDVLEDQILIDDPEFYSAQWSIQTVYRRQTEREIPEDVCLDRIKAGEPAIRGE